MIKNLPSVSIIAPVRNEAAYIERCVLSILRQDYGGEMEILVVDGQSTDRTREIVQGFVCQNPNLQLLDNPGKIVPIGMNIALRQAKGEIIIRVDGHCQIAPDYVRRCVEHIQFDNIDGVGGPMETIGETDMAKAVAMGMSSPFGVGNSAFRTISGQTMMADTVPFPAYTREIVRRAGFYDEELMRNQDDEYNYRIRSMGGKILLAADIQSTYFSRTSLRGLWRQYFQYGFYKIRVLQKHPRQMSVRQFVPPVFVLALLFSILLALIPFLRFLSPIVPVSYLMANILASFYTAKKRGWKFVLYLPFIFAILHLSYGAGFVWGSVYFANRWGD